MTEATSDSIVKPVRTIGLASLIIACVLTSMATIAINMWLMRDVAAGGKNNVVYIDSRRLIDAKALEISARNIGEEDGAKEGVTFAEALKSLVAEYHAKGITVLNGAVLLSDNEENDITVDVAKRLGVDLDIKGQFYAASRDK